MSAVQEVEVIVIGAGLSGLAAARVLTEHNVEVLVLEARDRVGGRTFTVKNDLIKYVDLGGAFVGPTQDRILRYADEFGVKTYLTNEIEDLILYRKGKSQRFDGVFPPVGNFFAYLDLNNILRMMDKMGEEIPAEAPWKAPHAEEWDNMTVQEFVNKNVWTDVVKRFVRSFVNLNVTSEPYECSLLWLLWYVKQCGGTMRINATTNGGQERKFVGGSQQISEKVAQKIGKDRVLLERPVCQIKQRRDGVDVIDIHGTQYKANYVISAVPIALQNKIVFDPQLPALRNQLIQRIPMGSVIKTFVYYDSPFWKKKDLCGTSLIDDDDAIVSNTMDDTKPNNEGKPALMSFILADTARQLVHLTKEERKQRICKLYAKVFDSPEALEPVHYEEKDWLSDQWAGGCYTAMMPPGFLTKFGKELRRPFEKVYFAGTETSTEWSGYMNGAIEAGERAAREILAVQGKIPADQIWLKEQENEEVKSFPFETSFFTRHLPSPSGFLRLTSFGTFLVGSCIGIVVYKRHLLHH